MRANIGKDTMFGEFMTHVIKNNRLSKESHWEGDSFICQRDENTMDDGIVIEICLHVENRLRLWQWDVSADKSYMDSEEEFLDYLSRKGIRLVSENGVGNKFHYDGPVENSDSYMIRFHRDDC